MYVVCQPVHSRCVRMGSLPDLTERSRPTPVRAAVRTVSDPHRHRTVITPIPVSTIYKKEWPWKKQKTPIRVAGSCIGPRRRDSAASSVGAASVRRLLARQPPKLPKPLVNRFTLLCISSGLCATALLPFTAFAGAEAGAMPLSIMHTAAAVVAPFSPLILQKTGTRLVIAIAHTLVCVLLTAHTVETPLPVLLALYGICGVSLSPMSLALSASATSLAQAAGDEARRKVALRRALRALRAAQDLGLVCGSLLLGFALLIWSEEVSRPSTPVPTNISVPRWPPPEEYFLEDDYEERTCGSAGCPDMQTLSGTVLDADGRMLLVAMWAFLALLSVGLGVYGASSAPAPPPDARSVFGDPRTLLGVPMGLFIGLQQGFIYTSYIKWYGVCVDGWWCAWRSLCGTGVLQGLAAGTLSMAAARGRRGALAAGGGAAHASLVLALLRWRAAKTDLALPALAAAAWGACAALWDVLQAGICIGGPGWRGAWSMILSARHLGLALACIARTMLCVRSQLAGLAAALLAALVTHTMLELRLRRGDANRQRS
ncbi:protein unc-93 homolog A [Helicoverpa zea]|uniref:protein unc-93 homolog A n=1 Tax=Helicoverpa zea TaxID=7113 RepID=UPI001F59E9EB|nr:protein unc-93 homolog A [Helicoverpa zea]